MIFGKHINRYYLRYAGLLLLGILSLAMVDCFQLIVPRLYKYVVNGIGSGYNLVPSDAGFLNLGLFGQSSDEVEVAFDLPFLLDRVCMPLIAVIAVMVTGRFAWRICFFGSGILAERDIRHRMFDRARLLSQDYYQVNKVGHMMSLFTNDLETVQDCFGSGVLMLCDALLLGVLALYKMVAVHPILTLYTLIPIGFLFAVGLIVGKYMMKKWEMRQVAYSNLSDHAQESFSGIAVVKAFVKEAFELSTFRRLNRKNENANVEFTRASVLLNIFITLSVESVTCVVLGYGGYLVFRPDVAFNAGDLIEFIGYFGAIVWPVMAVSELIDMRARGRASLKRIGTLLDTEPGVKDRPDTEEGAPICGGIEFRHLHFRHPGAQADILSDVSFSVLPGERVGIIGKTGSGKTTVADLLLRVYNVEDGMLFLDGRDINSYPVSAVRRQISYVPQDNFLFSDTIENNIAFSSDSLSHTEVEKMAGMADVHRDIMEFPQGYDTVLGERGVTVSGGQKQRISIARALCKRAPILILDDAVSAVDTATETAILDNLAADGQKRTLLMIAHRISTVEGLDKIIYLEQGRVVAVGTHDELYRTCEGYRCMVDLQKLEEEKAGDINA